MKTSGKRVLITGGGAGIGLAMAQAFMNADSHVVICGRTMSTLEQAQRAHPKLEIAQCDVTDDEQIIALHDRCLTDFGGIDILVNNAAIIHRFDMTNGSLPLKDQIKEYDINLGGPIRVTHHFLPQLFNRPEAAIVNLTSALAFMPTVASPIYSATKAALRSWTISLRTQLADTNVKVFELIPPLVDTQMNDNYDAGGVRKMSPEAHASHFMKGFAKDRLEIAVGISRGLPLLSRIAPKAVFSILNR
ncbi:MAG: SDR family NAD(P)-dependent oxidoreductase [Chloroflexota bacterium]